MNRPVRQRFFLRHLRLSTAACAALACALVALASPRADAVLANIGTPIATRLTSTANLTPTEVAVHALLGRFRGFLGTPIDATHFITAQHIGISPTDTIVFTQGPNQGSYAIRSWADDPGSDLRIVEIEGTLRAWVPLNGSGMETNQTATIFGRGAAPQAQVVVNSELKGWTTSATLDGAISWGRNVVAGTLGWNQLFARFDRSGLSFEAGLTVGDSGGPWLAADAQGLLRLIGVSASATGPYQTDVAGVPSGTVFDAALMDTGGLWVGAPGSAVFVAENPVDNPAVLVASRISNRIGWIGTQITIPVDDTDGDGIANQFDNCPFVANATQADNGGPGSAVADGIGNACQCGDVTGEGQVTDTDASQIKRRALGLSAPLFVVLENCDVSGDGRCTGTDATLIRHAAVGSPPALFGQNCPNALP